MKANKKVMLGAALVVAIVALAGVGYAAAVGYKSTTVTTTQNNVQDSKYIVISADASAYTTTPVNKVFGFDTTTTYNGGLKVSFDACYDISGATPSPVTLDTPLTYQAKTYNAVAVATPYTVTVDFNKAGSEVNSADVEITVTGTFTSTGNAVKVFLVKGTEVLTPDNEGKVTFNVPKASNTFTIGLYVAVPSTAIDYAVGGLSNDTVVDAALSFVATSSTTSPSP